MTSDSATPIIVDHFAHINGSRVFALTDKLRPISFTVQSEEQREMCFFHRVSSMTVKSAMELTQWKVGFFALHYNYDTVPDWTNYVNNYDTVPYWPK